ncbi:TonB-dependent receptor [Muribaculum gordoncarteri]|uniref:TonB-dependent receptor n=2 Tax=Muribaculum gordoncarteri TaxID=2530390 RepID=A0A4P7VS83_9BACT|nr:TonB-dependent receptor [Muribaculum gordoncarteri]QCD37130.1 TonB-dependent receptor [Muribaculum gordoncarteri]
MLAISLTIQGADSGGSRLLKGRILDNEHNPLPGAVVILDGKAHSAVADADGFYSFSNLESGTHRLNISYLGFVPVSQAIVLADTDVTQDIIMSDSSKELNEVVVTGVFSGQQRAINAQKSNINVTNIVSADQIGKFPDSNIGDALKRISGINVQYDQGEARFGQVRGTPADFSSVTINGSRIPSAEGDIRNVQLDLIPSDMIQTIEVNKTLMPDQDGDAIGGSINLVTKNSPRRLTLNAVAGTGYNWISRKAQMNFGLTIGNRFFNDRLGIMVSASYNNAPSGSYNTEFIWGKDDAGKLYLSDYQIRQYYVTRERQSYSLSADWKFNDFNKIWFKGIFNNRNDWENRYRTTLKDITPDGVADVRVQTKGGSHDNRNARLERQRTMDFTLGGENRLGFLSLDWRIGYARASEERPNERYIDFRLKKQHFSFDLSNPRTPFATPDEGSTMLLDDKFSLKDLTQQQEDITEQDLKASLDFKTRLSDRSKLKFGFKFVNKTKDKEIDYYEYTPVDKKGFNKDALAHSVNESTDRFMPSSRYQTGSFISKQFLGSLNLDDASLFEKAQVAEELVGNYNARENVTAGYIRLDSRITDNLNFTGGLRVENTALRYTGRIYDDESGTVSKTDPESSSYINFLPSMIFKWDVNKDFMIRAGYNQSISRPKYSALVPGMNIKRGDNEIVIGNPGLKATTSHNIDLNAEYYWKSIGLVSAGLFYKRIEGFIVDEVSFNHEYEGHVWTKFTQPKNGGNANIFGAEFSYQRDFSFIAPALRCVGLYGTYTYTHSRVTDFNFEGRENEKGLSLPGSPEHTANVSLYFEKFGLSARLSFNYASDFIDEMGASKFYDRYYDSVKYMDFNISYTFGKKTKFTIYADCTNLLNQPLRYYQGSKDLTMQQEYYGVKINGGIKVSF